MDIPVIKYDELSDTLYISFAPGESATGLELNPHILLRVDKAKRAAIGLTFFEYSLLAQPTELGPRSFPLTGLNELSAELRTLAVELLTHLPVSDILHLSAYTPSAFEVIPITSVVPLAIAA
jgi:uncharacterized protein YuzE